MTLEKPQVISAIQLSVAYAELCAAAGRLDRLVVDRLPCSRQEQRRIGRCRNRLLDAILGLTPVVAACDLAVDKHDEENQ